MAGDALPPATTTRKRKPRGRGLRTRTGCQSCRSRRVKCDETRPECRACAKAGRACLYVAPEDSSSTQTDQVTPNRQGSVEHEQLEETTPGIDIDSAPVSEPNANTNFDNSTRSVPSPVQQVTTANAATHRHVAIDRPSTALSHESERNLKGTPWEEENAQDVTAPILRSQLADGSISHELASDSTIDHIRAGLLSDHAVCNLDLDLQRQTHNVPSPHSQRRNVGSASQRSNTQAVHEQIDASLQPDNRLPGQFLYDTDAFETSPGSTWSDWANLSAEAASLSWFGLLATDATNEIFGVPNPLLTPGSSKPLADIAESHAQLYTSSGPGTCSHEDSSAALTLPYISRDDVRLTDDEMQLFHHFVRHLSGWIDITDPDRYFAVVVPQMALANRGLMMAILALSARHLSLGPSSCSTATTVHLERTSAVQYYYETLKYLQREMEDAAFLRSDELLATVVTISTYEMIDGSSRGWERHLKGVFWIQRSQTIQGESEGLKKRIWWAWLRQDIWVAFKEGRKILSYYQLTRPCTALDFWELVDRAVWLLGQCVNYASTKEVKSGRDDVQDRLNSSSRLWDSLNEWYSCFENSDKRLPVIALTPGLFQPIWINPPQASVYPALSAFELMLTENRPRYTSSSLLEAASV